MRTSTETATEAVTAACTVQGSPRFGAPRTFKVTIAEGDGSGVGGGWGVGVGVGVGPGVETGGVKMATLLSLDSLFAKS
jgi:hypothetical protein